MEEIRRAHWAEAPRSKSENAPHDKQDPSEMAGDPIVRCAPRAGFPVWSSSRLARSRTRPPRSSTDSRQLEGVKLLLSGLAAGSVLRPPVKRKATPTPNR